MSYLTELSTSQSSLVRHLAAKRNSPLAWAGYMPSVAATSLGTRSRTDASRSGRSSPSDVALCTDLPIDEFKQIARRGLLARERELGRVGWIWVTGSIQLASGTRQPCCFPIYERRVRLHVPQDHVYPEWLSPLALSDLIVRLGGGSAGSEIDPALSGPSMPGVENEAQRDAVRQLLKSCGINGVEFADEGTNPVSLIGRDPTVVVMGAGFFLTTKNSVPAFAPGLGRWKPRSKALEKTAFARLVTGLQTAAIQRSRKRPEAPDLNASQRSALERLDHEQIVVVSGPPGSGKTHLIAKAAAALSANGKSVVVATASDHATSSVREALENAKVDYHPIRDQHRTRQLRPTSFADRRRRRTRNRRDRRRLSSQTELLAAMLVSTEVAGRAIDVCLDKVAVARTASHASKTSMVRAQSAHRQTRIKATSLLVGTLKDIGDALPAVAGLVDVAIVDEASQVDLLGAAHVLARANQALIVGDPRQLRHWKPLSGDAISLASRVAGLDPDALPPQLDVEANSLFDVATGVSAVTLLTEHYRSLPHLIEFSAKRWYQDQLHVLTRHPRNEGLDRIETVHVSGPVGSRQGEAEVEAIMTHLRDHVARRKFRDARTIGVITPFPDQARFLEQAIIDEFNYFQLEDLGMRVGTIDEMIGSERDILLVSLGVRTEQLPLGLPIIEDPERFNVMITRARQSLTLFHSFDPAALPAGLLRDYFQYEKRPPGPPTSPPHASAFVNQLAEIVRSNGSRAITNYPVGPWAIDLVVGEGETAIGVDVSLASAGLDSFIDRRITLAEMGWNIISMPEPEWSTHVRAAAEHLYERQVIRASEVALREA